MQASKEIGRPIVHEFSREALAEAGATHTVPPFSIVSSNTMDLSVGRYVWYNRAGPSLHHAVVWTSLVLKHTHMMTWFSSHMRVQPVVNSQISVWLFSC